MRQHQLKAHGALKLHIYMAAQLSRTGPNNAMGR
jgi:hypothetical protein